MSISLPRRTHRLILLSIVLLALFRGGLYATYLPPWGLIDEEHHFHYIQHLAEQRTIPIVGKTYLSPEIIESLFATRRWEMFHWPTPDSPDPRAMGLEGHSYEGYQPPLLYILLVPLYQVLPVDVLTKLYCLRGAMVALSLLTIWLTYRTATVLFPQRRALPYFLCCFLVIIPERTAAVSRINNDVLLEVIATAFIWVCTDAIMHGLSIRQSQTLGVVFGLGMWTKMSMIVLVIMLPFVFWANRRSKNLKVYALWIGGIAIAMIAPLFARNLRLYGDLTGFASFRELNEVFGVIAKIRFTTQNLFVAVRQLFCHMWVVWWKGSRAAHPPLLNGLCILWALLSSLSLATVLIHLLSKWRSRNWGRYEQVLSMYLFAIGSYAVAVLVSYFDGRVPVIQGRFLLPVIMPLVILFVWGLSGNSSNKTPLLVSLGTLILADTMSFFGNLLPYFYYWSAFVRNGSLQPHRRPGWQQASDLFLTRLLSDKPPGMRPILICVLTLYAASLVFAGIMSTKALSFDNRHFNVLNDIQRE